MIHSILPPSSAHIWGAPDGCTGWVKMMESVPEQPPTEDSMEGEAAHGIGEQLILKGTSGSYKRTVLKVGEVASNGVIVTDEMVDCATVYANDFMFRFNAHKDDKRLLARVEDTGPVSIVHEKCFGTKDSWMYSPKLNRLFIWDYKHGHVSVDAFKNWQLICYALGIMTEYQLPDSCIVNFRIIQPRAFGSDPVSKWQISLLNLRPYYTTLRDNAVKALSNRAELHTGPHCRYCDARTVCAPAIRAGVGFFEMCGAPVPVEITPNALGAQLTMVERALKQLKGLKSGYEEQIKAVIKNGKNVPGWGLETAMSNETWNAPPEQIIGMGKLLGIDVAKLGVKTPNQARALGMDAATIAALSGRTAKGFKLVPDDGTKLEKEFG